MRLVILLFLPLYIIAGNMELVKSEVFKKPEDRNEEISSCRPDTYLKIIESFRGNLPDVKNESDKFLLEIIDSRFKNQDDFKSFEMFYKVNNIKHISLGSVKEPGQNIYFHTLMDINPELMHTKLKNLIEKYKDIYNPLKSLKRDKFYTRNKHPEVFAITEKLIQNYKPEVDPDAPPNIYEEEVPTDVLREISDVIHSCQITTLDDYINDALSPSKVLNVSNRIYLDDKYLFPLYEAVLFCQDRGMKYNFIELLMFQDKVDYRTFRFLAHQIVFWKDAGLAKLLLKALNRHPSLENLKTAIYIFNSSSKPSILISSFAFSSPYYPANDLRENHEKKWQNLFFELKNIDNKAFQVLLKTGLVKESQ